MKIKVYRTILDLTQEDLGKIVGCSGNTIGNIERGKYNTNVQLALRIAKALRTTVEEIDEFHE